MHIVLKELFQFGCLLLFDLKLTVQHRLKYGKRLQT